MTRIAADELERYELGELTLAELDARADEDTMALAHLHDALRREIAEPVTPPPWVVVAGQLDHGPPPRARRTLVGWALAGLFVVGGAASAASAPVREVVVTPVARVVDWVTGNDADPADDAPAVTIPQPSPSDPVTRSVDPERTPRRDTAPVDGRPERRSDRPGDSRPEATRDLAETDDGATARSRSDGAGSEDSPSERETAPRAPEPTDARPDPLPDRGRVRVAPSTP